MFVCKFSLEMFHLFAHFQSGYLFAVALQEFQVYRFYVFISCLSPSLEHRIYKDRDLILSTIQHCLNYYSFIISLKVGYSQPLFTTPRFFFFFKKNFCQISNSEQPWIVRHSFNDKMISFEKSSSFFLQFKLSHKYICSTQLQFTMHP